MPAFALIAPDNRLLGWSLTDLTLYGTQPVPGMVVGRANDAIATPESISDATSAPSDPAALAPALHDITFHDIADDQTALLDGGTHGGGAVPGAAAAPLSHTPASQNAEFAPSVPQPIGSGSFVQPPVATALPVVEPHGDGAHAVDVPAASSPLAPALDGAQPSAAIATVLDATHDVLAASAPAPVGNVVAPATDPVAPLGELAGRGLDTVAPVTDLLGHAFDAPAPVSDLLGHTLDAAAPAAGLVGTTLDAVDHALAPVDHGPAESFGGTDPAAGIATLVGMVDSADAFDIGHAVNATATQPAGSILDALAHDALPAPLLGDDAHHDDAANGGGTHVVDDHGFHLGL